MAAPNRQSQFYRCLSFFFLVALTLAAVADDIGPSGYRPTLGETFFLLAESGFGSDQQATVRLEAPQREWPEQAASEESETAPEGGQASAEAETNEAAPDEANDDPLLAYAGADIVVYRIPDALEFLKRQKNLHRIQVEGVPREEGLANAVNYVWDTWYKKSRLAWQRIFSAEARTKVVEAAPELKQTPPHSYRTRFRHPPQFKRLEGFEQVAAFRYPIWDATPIAPPQDTKMSGSSSEFIRPRPGNVRIPVGKLKPGLYLVEAYIGAHRATTVVFVSDTVAVTKTSGDQLLVWTAHRTTGTPMPDAKLLLSDGVGILQSGSTDAEGLLLMERKSPERSYVLGMDAEGGVFVSENFYYDSEIYATKLYAFTDRPLYHPGDTVQVKLMGRVFENARKSTPLAAGDVRLTVLDPSGTPVTAKTFPVRAEAGGDTAFELPKAAIAGGYTLHMGYRGSVYTGSFRVGQYAKPHFEIDIALAQAEFKTGQPVKGSLRLVYPNGKPVRDAKVELSLRARALTMVGDEIYYPYQNWYPIKAQGLFPQKLLQSELTVGSDGRAEFELPAAKEPSRYVLSVRGFDQAAYRVTAMKEILIQPGTKAYALVTDSQLTRIGDSANFTLRALNTAPGEATQWEAVRLEDQTRMSGTLDKEGFAVRFERSGSYTVSVKAGDGNILGSVNHWVAGPELQSSPGGIQIVLDKPEYRPGETAKASISFPVPVENALVTLERDRVAHHGLLSGGGNWIRLTRQSELQWSAEIPVEERYSPNMTFSVVYVRNGDYVFQNKGITVKVPRIRVAFQSDKPRYAPGETVEVEVSTTLEGEPLPARLTVGVVDEMVYVLQPEIAPDIGDFFYHIRRNQVRTASSLNFHTYDKAIPAVRDEPLQASYSNRALKMLERPRRENIDTALWLPNLETGPDGKAHFSFVMPQSLSRWRITGRAMSADGRVGQGGAYVLSGKDYYLKWSGPTRFRQGDQPVVTLLGFNQGTETRTGKVSATGPGLVLEREIDLHPGANYLELPLKTAQDGVVVTKLEVDGNSVDHLETVLSVEPQGWLTAESMPLKLMQAETPVSLPADAKNIRLSLSGRAADSFLSIADSLIEYPYGCVEQTASRLLPLTLIYRHLKPLDTSGKVLDRLHNRIAHHRLRLARMAGPEAAFGWWGDLTRADPFLTAYAYYTDWNALAALGIEAPGSHWATLLDVYKYAAVDQPLLHKAVILWMSREMGLPVRTLLGGAIEEAIQAAAPVAEARLIPSVSRFMEEAKSRESEDMALLLLSALARAELQTAKPQAEATAWLIALEQLARSARERLADLEHPLAQAVLLATKTQPDAGMDALIAEQILASVGPEMATIDRALTLAMVDRALDAWEPAVGEFDPGPGWQKRDGEAGASVWHRDEGAGPPVIQLKEEPLVPVSLRISYDRYTIGESRLPVRIERKLYRVEPVPAEERAKSDSEGEEGGEEGTVFRAVPVDEPWKVEVGQLYLDEVRLASTVQSPFRFGVVDVPLPPGADVEPTTWGLFIEGLPGEAETVEMPESRRAGGERGYSIPVDQLQGSEVFRHLVRFGQRGGFSLPPARYFRMYRPDDQAYEAGSASRSVAVR
ncbi:uncharacterized protein sS8_1601 [Methylocaldum marinum]|uniref:Alpha-2-macroglobulin family protein n=1 Tax=Methylocaldum marinum TaxID=1432792 RepID=A0A250KUV2_9GAMM|nr:alpha-2-macroglobulin [Methylocaldum marinum]BBA33559.1 uncharacterized protein sS8_1601 [Methylocaldum marinum]